jgi:predicted ATPase
MCLSRLANTSWQRGRADRGRVHVTEMLALAEELGHQFTLATALHIAALNRLWRCEPEIAYECANRAFEISERYDYPFTYAWSLMLRGQATHDLGQRDDGMKELNRGFEQTRKLTTKLMEPLFMALLASAKTGHGQTEDASALLRDAFAIVAETGAAYTLPLLHCLSGELLLQNATVEAEMGTAYESFINAEAISRAHGSRALEVRAIVGTFKSCLGDFEKEAALGRLKEVLGHFTLGSDSKDLRDALAIVENNS